jgi:hypothetical protein
MSYIDTGGCRLETCPISLGYVEYVPTLAGNTTYLALFAAVLVVQGALGIRFRSWTFLGGMAAGILLEIIGYVGRILLHSNPFNFQAFLLYESLPHPLVTLSAFDPGIVDNEQTDTSYV